ncbi:MAG: DNA/RNA non-specific endonuclease [Myxococcota bacterium]
MRVPNDPQIARELELALSGSRPLPPGLRRGDVAGLKAVLDQAASEAPGVAEAVGAESAPSADEAIVRLFGRPVMLVDGDRIVPPDSAEWRRRLAIFRPVVEPLLKSVGRVRLTNSDRYEWAGTAWLVAPSIAITNRHVAEEFCHPTGAEPPPLRSGNGDVVTARIDFGCELADSPATVAVKRVLYAAPPEPGQPDIAVLQLEGADMPPPIPLAAADAEVDDWLGVIGYPAHDSRTGADAQSRIFGDVYEVKRFSPGQVIAGADLPIHLAHDASTLGGNSGSVLVSLGSGEAVGLHFSGRYLRSNFAGKASEIRRVLGLVGVVPAAAGDAGVDASESVDAEKAPSDPTHKPSFYEGREGFQEGFLGAGFEVGWPGLGAWEGDLAPRIDAGAPHPHRLDYTHFSLLMSASRRMPILTAVNIDGRAAVSIKRTAVPWHLDGRIARKHQIGDLDAYHRNKLDKGHMVRREDPNWGDEAEQANVDTFHYTNACPQHALLNQRTWLELESYVLDGARTKDLKVSIFTGPILREDDFPYRDIQVPAEFFKVVVVVDAELGRLEATGYLQSQTDYLGDDLDEAVFDGGSTYQVPIVDLMNATGLDFSELAAHDPMSAAGAPEAPGPGGFRGRRVRSAGDIRHHRRS